MTDAKKRYDEQVLENRNLLAEFSELGERYSENVRATDAAVAATRKLREENVKILAEIQKQHAEIQAIVDKLVGHKKAR